MAPQLASVVTVANNAELAMPKRVSLPSMLPPGCVPVLRLSMPEFRQDGITRLFVVVADEYARQKHHRHGGE